MRRRYRRETLPMDAAQVATATSGEASESITTPALETIRRTVEWSRRTEWTWPVGETGLLTSFNTVGKLVETLKLFPGRRICIQAGGAAGVFPAYLADHFRHVYTFEPNPWLFRCLMANCTAENVHRFEAALGAWPGMVAMDPPSGYEHNQGAWHVSPGGYIPMLRVDDLGLDGCDFLMLDVEGGERDVLDGAKRTVEAYRPWVVVESKHSILERRGVPRDWLDDFCVSNGYTIASKKGSDYVLRP